MSDLELLKRIKAFITEDEPKDSKEVLQKLIDDRIKEINESDELLLESLAESV